MIKVEEYIKDKQPNSYKELNKKRKKRKHKKKERKPDEHLSFSDIDYMMRHNRGIDERRCR